jgi:predicted RNA-binding protein with PIN domain
MSTRTIVIDGYNIIRTTPAFFTAEKLHGPAAGREALLRQLSALFNRSSDEIFVVFDGDGPAERCEALRGVPHGHVIYTRYGEIADTVILRLCTVEQAGMRITVVTNDGEVRACASEAGASPVRSDHLAAQIARPPKLLRQRQRARLGALWDHDRVNEDGEPIRQSRKGNARRAPRRRRM